MEKSSSVEKDTGGSNVTSTARVKSSSPYLSSEMDLRVLGRASRTGLLQPAHHVSSRSSQPEKSHSEPVFLSVKQIQMDLPGCWSKLKPHWLGKVLHFRLEKKNLS